MSLFARYSVPGKPLPRPEITREPSQPVRMQRSDTRFPFKEFAEALAGKQETRRGGARADSGGGLGGWFKRV